MNTVNATFLQYLWYPTMYYLLFIIAFVVAAMIYRTSQEPDPIAPMLGPVAELRAPAVSTSLTNLEGQPAYPADSLVERANENDNNGVKNRVINIGKPADPDDPYTWEQSDDSEVINIGEPVDPDNPYTWQQSADPAVINIGEAMNPDDPSTWQQSADPAVISIAEPVDPDDPYTWQQSTDAEFTNTGEPMNPDDPYRWPQQ